MTSPYAAKATNITKSLLEHFHKEQMGEMLDALSDEGKRALEEANTSSASPKQITSSFEEALGDIHYSWLGEAIKEEDPYLQSLYLMALDGRAQEELTVIFDLPEAPPLSKPMQGFFLRHLKDKIGMKPVVPIPCLPPSPLNALLELNKSKLVRLIGYLGLHDLAAKMKTCIDRDALYSVTKLLSQRQRDFVKMCMQAQDPLPRASVPLADWSLSRDHLTHLAQTRGLERLGVALSHQSRSLLWYLTRHLDTGRGDLLIKYAKADVTARVAEQVISQVSDLYNFLGDS